MESHQKKWELSINGKSTSLVINDHDGRKIFKTRIRKKDLAFFDKASESDINSIIELHSKFIEKIDKRCTFNFMIILLKYDSSLLKEICEENIHEAFKFIELLHRYNKLYSIEEIRRLKRIINKSLMKSNTKEVNFSSFPFIPRGQKVTTTEWLNFIEFITNAKDSQNLIDFKYSKDDFWIPLERAFSNTRSLNRAYQIEKIFMGNETKLTKTEIDSIAYRVIHLSKRSRKLKKYIENLTKIELIQAFSYEIPGHLLVNDTIELLDSLKNIEYNKTDEDFYSSNLASHNLGKEILEKAIEHDETPELQTLIYLKSEFLTDASWYYNSQLPFVIHGIKILGPKKVLEQITLIDSQTEGVTMRAWMELIRQGGFNDDLPASWQAPLLASK